MPVARLSMTVLGGAKMAEAFAKNAELAEAALASGLYLGASNVMTQSKAVTPVELGVLRASGYVTLPERGPLGPVVELGYGGPAAAYAVYVHEVQGSHPQHGPHNCNGDWKYLEKPLHAARGSLWRFIGRVAAEQFRRGAAGTPPALHPTSPGGGP